MVEAIIRLEGRINRLHDHQESLIYSMKEDQLQFQSDISSTLTAMKMSESTQVDGRKRLSGGWKWDRIRNLKLGTERGWSCVWGWIGWRRRVL